MDAVTDKVYNCIFRYVISVAFSSDGQYLASGSNDKTVMIWKLQSEDQLFCKFILSLCLCEVYPVYMCESNII